MDLSKREAYAKAMLTCRICHKLIKNVTIIEECCHRFCKKCITKKLTEEKLRRCPICNIDLDRNPLEKLRLDNHWKEIRDVIRSKRRDEIQRGFLQHQVQGETEAAAVAAAVQVADAAAAAASSPKRNGRRKASKQGEFASSNNQMPKDPFEAMNELRKALISPEENAGGENGADISGSSKGKEIIVIDDDDDHDNNRNCTIEGSNVVSEQAIEPPSTPKNPGIWFHLVPSYKKSCESRLPEMPDGGYILVRDVHTSVSVIRKYIAQKLNLQSEHQVEISVLGKAVVGDEMTLLQLLGLWCEGMPKVESQVYVGSSAKDFLMILTYARSNTIYDQCALLA